MIDVIPDKHRSQRTVTTVGGTPMSVTVDGPAFGRTIIMLEEPARNALGHDNVRERLQVAMCRIVTIPVDGELSTKSIIGILDQLRIAGGLLVGAGSGAELAWQLAARCRERFTGLVAIDRGHPRVPNAEGHVRDADCPAVEVDTTILFEGSLAHGIARGSRRHVHGDFRLVDLAGPPGSRHFASQLATEIVMRALSR